MTYREEAGEFLCDSPKLLEEAVRWGGDIETVILAKGERAVCPAGPRMVETPGDVLVSLADTETPQGVVFSCRAAARCLPERLAPGRYLVLDGIQDPGNVGTILRTANAFGATVILLPGCADLYNPKTLRSAMGAHFRDVQWRCTLDETASLLQQANIPLYATALRADTEDLRSADLSNAAVVIGSEGKGISEEMLSLCEKTLKIPMEEKCESLNAAVAAAVVLWEGYCK